MDPQSNPVVLLAYLIGAPTGLALLVLLVKGIFFIAESSKDIKTVVKYVHDRRALDQAEEVTMTLVENDINVIQAKIGVDVRVWPDRRVALRDRRAG